MASLEANVAQVRLAIATACQAVGRQVEDVRLVAVTKSQEPAVLAGLARLGIQDIGENRLEHLLAMRAVLPQGMRMHAIGRLQSRQIPKLVASTQALHSLCEVDHVAPLARALQEAGKPFEVFLQVNLSGEASKAGVDAEGLPPLLAACRTQGVPVAGLMTMAPQADHAQEDPRVRACFRACAALARQHGLQRLSMGMSGDFPVAIQEGATDIRVGTRLFA